MAVDLFRAGSLALRGLQHSGAGPFLPPVNVPRIARVRTWCSLAARTVSPRRAEQIDHAFRRRRRADRIGHHPVEGEFFALAPLAHEQAAAELAPAKARIVGEKVRLANQEGKVHVAQVAEECDGAGHGRGRHPLPAHVRMRHHTTESRPRAPLVRSPRRCAAGDRRGPPGDRHDPIRVPGRRVPTIPDPVPATLQSCREDRLRGAKPAAMTPRQAQAGRQGLSVFWCPMRQPPAGRSVTARACAWRRAVGRAPAATIVI